MREPDAELMTAEDFLSIQAWQKQPDWLETVRTMDDQALQLSRDGIAGIAERLEATLGEVYYWLGYHDGEKALRNGGQSPWA
jgi:hypothetical protein